MDNQELEQSKKIILLSETLKAIRDIDPNYPKQMRQELSQKLGQILLEALPPHIGILNLTEGVIVSRPDEQLKFIPVNKRGT